jgi:hypothetical protein
MTARPDPLDATVIYQGAESQTATPTPPAWRAARSASSRQRRPTLPTRRPSVAYELLTGRPPFEGRTLMGVIDAHANRALVRPGEVRQNIPADVEAIVIRCLFGKSAGRSVSDGCGVGGCFRSVRLLDRMDRELRGRVVE